MSAWYNEIDTFAAAWLRELIKAGHIADGVVDERSIEDVTPDDLREFTQCHFFAGIGVWSYALRRAGWPDDRPVWTGSCPCQPFSAAGKGGGFDDERHLWPAWDWLIDLVGPPVIFGEQVASKDAEPWLDLVQADLEDMDYAFGAVAFPSASVGAPHIRDRTYWVADANGMRQSGLGGSGQAGAAEPSEASGVGHAKRIGTGRNAGAGAGAESGYGSGHVGDDARPSGADADPGPVNGLWRNADWLLCRDEKWRPVEPGAFPLAHGAPARVGRLRGYGNAINAQQAQIFIEAYLESLTP